MSGGSHNYLCLKDTDNLFSYETLQDIDKMASRLIELGYDDAAIETLNIKNTIIQSMTRCRVMKERLESVWKSVEWYDSNDWGLDSVSKAISEYRNEEETS